MKVVLKPHVNGLVQLFVDVHPIQGRENWRVGYANPADMSWSYIVEHGFYLNNKPSVEHLETLDALVEAALREFANPGPDSEGERPETEDSSGA